MRRTHAIWIAAAALFLSISNALAAAQPGTPPSPWWTDRTAGLIGGIVGTVVGFCGAAIGILCSMGKGRHFVLAAMKVLIAVGAMSLVMGLLAVSLSQPYAVYYPLLLGGAILVLVLGLNYRTARRRFEEIELRRMESMDAS